MLVDRYQMDIDMAIEDYFNNQLEYRSNDSVKDQIKQNSAELILIFRQFVENGNDNFALEDNFLEEYLRFCGLGMNSKSSFLLFYKLGNAYYGSLTKDEFVNGWGFYGIDNTQKMKAFCEDLKTNVISDGEFKEFYRWIFFFVKENKKSRSIRTFFCLIFYV
jgi:hypothetical protein